MTSKPVAVVHVGLPKSGTTFVQGCLLQHREALGPRGVLYPQTDDDVMFRAALDVRGNHKTWGRRRSEVEGRWDDLCRRARRHQGVTVVSSELLAGAGPTQVDSALSMLSGLEVHVVVTARDPARQLTAEWQEGVKHGRSGSFEEFHARVGAAVPEDDLARRFHAAQDLPGVLTRWGRGIPRGRVHVVVGGPPGSSPDLLWRRFAAAAGLDVTGLPPSTGVQRNESLGAAEIDLLRRVNEALDGRLPQPSYGALVKHRLVRDLLSGRGAAGPVAPASAYDDAVHAGELWVKEITAAGYTVHGDVADLVPSDRLESAPHPDEVDARLQVEPAAEVIADLLLRLHAARTDLADQTSKRRSWKKKAKTLRRRLAELDA